MKDLDGLGWTWMDLAFLADLSVSQAFQVVGFGDSLPLNRQCGPQWAHASCFSFVHHVSAKTIAVSSLRAAFHHVKCSLEAK